jgi:hypothetical protein
MLSSLIFFALLQVACGLSIERPRSGSNNNPARSTPLQPRGLDVGSKVAIGICIPGAAFVVLLGLGIMWLYPAQLRKLRKANPGVEVGLREVMNGGVAKQPAPPPPMYTEHDASTSNVAALDASHVPGHATPKSDAPTTPRLSADAKHVAPELR